MHANLVAFLLKNLKQSFLTMEGPVRASIGNLHLGIHAHVPVKMDRIPRHHPTSTPETLQDLDQSIRPLETARGLGVPCKRRRVVWSITPVYKHPAAVGRATVSGWSESAMTWLSDS